MNAGREGEISEARRRSHERCREWLLGLREAGLEFDKISAALGVSSLILLDATREVWPRGSTLAMIWDVMGDDLCAMQARDVIAWAYDVGAGEQRDGLGKALALKRDAGFDCAYNPKGRMVAKAEMDALADLEAAHMEIDPVGYAARMREPVKREGAAPIGARGFRAPGEGGGR